MSNTLTVRIPNHSAAIPVALAAPASRTSGVLQWFSVVLGVARIRCQNRHQAHHHLHPIEFGGGYVVSCDLCSCVRYVRR